jgi:hypothetical protein
MCASEASFKLASMGAIFNLNHPAHTVHWHFITLSVANVVAMVIMLAVFALAITLPFPGHGSGHSGS